MLKYGSLTLLREDYDCARWAQAMRRITTQCELGDMVFRRWTKVPSMQRWFWRRGRHRTLGPSTFSDPLTSPIFGNVIWSDISQSWKQKTLLVETHRRLRINPDDYSRWHSVWANEFSCKEIRAIPNKVMNSILSVTLHKYSATPRSPKTHQLRKAPKTPIY